MGPVPVPGRALGLRHVHARLPLPPVAQQQGDRRRSVDPRLHPRDRERLRDRAQDPLQPPRRQRAVVDRRRMLDRHRRAHRHRRDGHVHRRLPVQVQRLLPLRPGIPAGLPRHRPLQGPDRASAVLVRRRGLRGQARCGDRQRRNRGDDDPRDGRRRRARDDAPALPQLHHVAAGRRPRREGAPEGAPGQARVLDRALEERAVHDGHLPAQPAPAQGDEVADPQGAGEGAAGRLRHRRALQSQLRPVGPAHVPGARQRPVRGDRRRQGVGGDRQDPDVHRDRARARVRRAARCRPDRDGDGPEPARPRRHRAERRRQQGRDPEGDELQGRDARRRAELRVHVRLHELVVDAAGRPRQPVRLPAARAHGRKRLPPVHADQPRRLDHHRAVHRSDRRDT